MQVTGSATLIAMLSSSHPKQIPYLSSWVQDGNKRLDIRTWTGPLSGIIPPAPKRSHRDRLFGAK